MGFFQDLKQDLSQSVGDVSAVETDLEGFSIEEAAKPEEPQVDEFKGLEAMLENSVDALEETSATMEETPASDLFSAVLVEEVAPIEETQSVEEITDTEVFGEVEETIEVEKLLDEVEQNLPDETFMESTGDYSNISEYHPAEISDDTAIITSGMTINGDVTSTGNMDLIGVVNGNVDIHGKLNITGNINGNSSAAEIYAESAQINGEVVSKGSVKIGQSSVVIGNISATSAVIAGAVKGDIDVQGPVILDTSAIVMGNIKSKSVQINNGAVIEGMCSQCYAEVSPTSFFSDVKKNRKAN